MALLLALAATAPGPGVGRADASGPYARVLLYHRVGDPRHPSTNVSREDLRSQLISLRAGGYRVVSTRTLEEHLLRGEPLPERAVVIHFDDGYRSVFDQAFPVLRELGLPFTVFLSTEAVDGGYPDYVTWDMVAEMGLHGGSFGAHGHRHLHLALPERGETEEQHRQRIQTELGESAAALRSRGWDPRWVAYPYGDYSRQVLAEAEEAGFALGFSQDPGAVERGSHPFRLPRFAVVGGLADLEVFQERLEYTPLLLSSSMPLPGSAPAGDRSSYGAVLRDPGRYDPSSLNVFVSELGRLEAVLDPATGSVQATGPGPLTRSRNRVLVSLRERATGRYALASWLVLAGDTEE